VTLLFKFLTWRKSRVEKEIKCIINNSRSESVARVSYKIIPIDPIIDHTFRVYDFYGSVVNLDIPFPESADYKRYAH
jgi:hypothetical protein